MVYRTIDIVGNSPAINYYRNSQSIKNPHCNFTNNCGSQQYDLTGREFVNILPDKIKMLR